MPLGRWPDKRQTLVSLANLWEGTGVIVSYSTKGHLWPGQLCLGDQGHLKPASRGQKSQPGKGSPAPGLLFDLLGTSLVLATGEPVFQGASNSHFSGGTAEAAAAAVACGTTYIRVGGGTIKGQSDGGTGYRSKVNYGWLLVPSSGAGSTYFLLERPLTLTRYPVLMAPQVPGEREVERLRLLLRLALFTGACGVTTTGPPWLFPCRLS